MFEYEVSARSLFRDAVCLQHHILEEQKFDSVSSVTDVDYFFVFQSTISYRWYLKNVNI